jgi:hypothetical protein
MHTNRISPARKILFWLGAALSLALFAGCEFQLTNLTPTTLPENPSQIYTLSLRVTQKASAIVPGSIDAHIVIDGQNLKMNQSPLGPDIFELEYQLPSGRDEMAYYYLVTYQIEAGGQAREREAYTEVIHTKIVRRNVLALLANRGPVGARISVLGRGFTPQDAIYLDTTAARTVFESPNALSFFVPALEANRNYKVAINGTSGNSPVGTFRIDPSTLQVSPSSLTLRTGEKQTLTFSVPNAAPAGGLLLDVTTDVPDAVIMPEVVVPEGQTSVSVTIEGGKAGTGSLFLKGYGSGEVSVPVSVTAR